LPAVQPCHHTCSRRLGWASACCCCCGGGGHAQSAIAAREKAKARIAARKAAAAQAEAARIAAVEQVSQTAVTPCY
jgi:hypothetical protein